MTRSTMFGALLVVASMFAVSCDDSAIFEEKTFPVCEQRSFRLTGVIDGKTVDITESGSGGGLSQDDAGGEYVYPAGGFDDDRTDLHFSWDDGVLTGEVSAAKGTVRMATGPFAGQTFCVAGDKTRFRIPDDETLGTVQFQLDGLRSGEGCTVVHTGLIQGCQRWE
jgi:hypothetical protein